MKRLIGMGLIALGVVACDNEHNPLTKPAPTKTGLDLPPGTTGAKASSSIQRYEAAGTGGNGYAQSITYDATTNTFTVDNLAFDGDNTYSEIVVPNLTSPFRVYESVGTFQDSVTGAPINQIPHKAVYGRSTNTLADGTTPVTEFAIVRTGGYVNYGFGGFMYERNQGVTLPTEGQATFTGAYAGLRDFKARGDIEYVTGQMTVDIDFADFNNGDGVKGHVTNRRIFDKNGQDVTAAVTTALGVTALPTVHFDVGPGVSNDAGELTGKIGSTYTDQNGALQPYETGKYYAVLAGNGANMEIAGVIVIEGKDPRWQGVSVRESGGFILYR